MISWGITAQNHDASIAVIRDGEILFASQSERYSGLKQDKDLNQSMINEAMQYGKPDVVLYYENPWKKKLRQLLSLDFKYVFNLNCFPKRYLKKYNIKCDIQYVDHHLSHALSGYNTCDFDNALIVVIDSVGEFKTISILKAENNKIEELESVCFPSSLGLFYSAFTKRCGLQPNQEEYILMGMAAFGQPNYVKQIKEDFFVPKKLLELKKYCHYGIGDYLNFASKEDLASSVQFLTEELIVNIMTHAKKIYPCENLVYMGGVALNCSANTSLLNIFKNIWIMPNPGDSGSCLGCASLPHGKLKWKNPYLGYDIKKDLDIDSICKDLKNGEIIGVANGKAEFGPRALGNRSLLADPRSAKVKDLVNIIKRRQKFRPFAPAVLEKDARHYFEIPEKSFPYMQYVFKCKNVSEVPSVCHVDGTSRVQTVSQDNNINFYNLISRYKDITGCPMVLNTSLNIRGKPIVNNEKDAESFSKEYKVKVY